MNNTFQLSLQESGICLDFGVAKYLMSYEETELTYDEAKEWVKERGGELFPCEHAITLSEHVEEINAKLKDAGKEKLSGWLWTNREHATNSNAAWVVVINNGYVGWYDKGGSTYVRAVSAL